MTKYIPLQIASLLYDILRENFTPRFRPKLNQYFITLLGKLEVFLKSGDQYVPRGGGLNFAYLDYNLPTLSKDDDYQGSPYNSDTETKKRKRGKKGDSLSKSPRKKGEFPSPDEKEPPQVESKPEPAPPAKKAKVIHVAKMKTVKPVFVNEEEPEDEERKLQEIQRTLEEMAEKARQEERMRLAQSAPQHATHSSNLSKQSQIVPSPGMSAEKLEPRAQSPVKPPSVQMSVKESLR